MVADPRRPRWQGDLARAGLYGAIALFAGTAQAATLEVVVANVRNGNGVVRIAVCTAETFLKEFCQVNADVKAVAGEVAVRLEVPPGIWAVQAYQDEDGNGAITRNILGIPTEGLGFSNDVVFRFGPPGFDEAAFRLDPAGGRIRLNLRYF